MKRTSQNFLLVSTAIIFILLIVAFIHDQLSSVKSEPYRSDTSSVKAQVDIPDEKPLPGSIIHLSEIKVSSKFGNDDATITIRSVEKTGQFIFDRYGDEWHYMNAERGTKIISVSVSIHANSKDPNLPPIAVYKMNHDSTISLIGTLDYRFHEWQDYGVYLGNYIDYGNDFAHSATIRFDAFVQLDDSLFKETICVIGNKNGCFGRSEDRSQTPPVSYSSGCNLKGSLSSDDLRNDYVVLKIYKPR